MLSGDNNSLRCMRGKRGEEEDVGIEEYKGESSS